MATVEAPLLDTRTLGKPPNFSGKPEDWTMWSFKFETWASLLPMVRDKSVDQILDWSVSRDEDDLMLTGMDERLLQPSRTVYFMLAQLLEGRALAILRRTPRGEGLRAWKRMKAEYEGGDGSRAVVLLMGLLQPQWDKAVGPRSFMEALEEWETEIGLYEKQTGDNIPGQVRLAVALSAVILCSCGG